jgi:hypothetical protein
MNIIEMCKLYSQTILKMNILKMFWVTILIPYDYLNPEDDTVLKNASVY